jgi:hypothetical protein
MQGQSRQLLQNGGISDTWLSHKLVLFGAGLDAILGLWLWLRPHRRVYLLALVIMVVMTLVATALKPDLWFHPLAH